MTGTHSIDTSFNVFQDTPAGKDPDVYSPTLKRYHQLLWSKPLPDGRLFQLKPGSGGDYLIADVEGEGLVLSSDAIASGFNQSRALWDLVSDAEYERERHISATIAGFMLWPQRKRAGKITINGAKGFSPRIKDRFDLTLECIRRHYSGAASPLSEVLSRYSDYFECFQDFAGFIEFWLLDDIVDNQGSIRFFMQFDDFCCSPLPDTLNELRDYRSRVRHFLEARNQRIGLADVSKSLES